ncbi:hypothetical protein [Salinimicrobium gaetbulicola]|uniref:Carboxypeptidase-like protein n=1 Tax=Salinimicrobium gaetbulicola TaxID=999702 RepID=A0ABW3IHQ4_9FLAO
MKNRILLVMVLTLLPLLSIAQQRQLMEARVVNNDRVLENVHIKNITTGEYTLTNKNGTFLLQAQAGDTLVLSHVAMNDLIRILETDEFSDFRMEERENELEEVSVSEVSEINAVSLGIIQKEIKPLTTNERKLHTAGDFKWIHLLGILGGSLQIDPILNAINGRTKKLKRNITIEKKVKNIAFLEGYADYMKNNMGLSETDMRKLIALAVEEGEIQAVIDSGNDARVQFFLQDTWIKFSVTE